MKFNALLLTFTLAFCISCAGKTTFQIASDPPGAKVFIKNLDSAEKTELGVTPVKLTEKEMKDKKIKSGPVLLEFELEGYHQARLLVTDVVAVDIDTSVPLLPMDKLAFSKAYDSISAQLVEVHRFIRQQQFDKALEITSKLRTDFPAMSTPEELEGSIYYLQNDFKKAHESFSSAYSKNTDSLYSLKMKKLIEDKLGTQKN